MKWTPRLVLFALTLPTISVSGGTGITHTNQDQPRNIADLTWMAGSWLERKNGTETEEHWMSPKGDIMLGVNRTVRETGRTLFEFMRIAQTAGGISYFASPGGRAATEFPMTELKDKRVVFENPKLEFPRRIIYWIEKDGVLHGRIEGKVKGEDRSEEWHWDRQK